MPDDVTSPPPETSPESESAPEVERDQLQKIARDIANLNDQGKQMVRLAQTQSLTISPTLPPEYLEAYERLCPGAGKRILLSSVELAEREQTVDLDIRREQSALLAEIERKKSARADRGQVFAFVLSAVTILGGIGLLALGKPIAGLGAIITPIAGLVLVFVTNRLKPADQRNEEKPNAEPPDRAHDQPGNNT
jgi:uncharacterized membrane protein